MTNKRLKVIGLLLLCTVCGHTQENMNRFIDQLMSRMTLDEKIGQLNLCVEGEFVAGENKGLSSTYKCNFLGADNKQ